MFCAHCKTDKPVTEFYVNSKKRCKACTRKSVREHRLAKIDYYRSYDRMRASMPHRLSQNVRVTSEWRESNKQRYKAQNALNNALRDGKIKRQLCLICGGKAEAHHPDYSAPLDVVWLCPPHHKQTHAMAKAA